MNKSFHKQSKLTIALLCATIVPSAFAQTNPFGSVQPVAPAVATTDINYGTGVNNVDGKIKPRIPKSIDVVPAGSTTNPVANQGAVALPGAQAPVAIPSQAPAGLPQEDVAQEPQVQVQYGAPSGNNPLDSMFGILNAPEDRIREINREIYNKGRVLNEEAYNNPRSVSGFVTAHLAPGSTSPVIRVARNRTTTIVVTDMTGQPWPIVNFDGLPVQDFDVKRIDRPAPDGFMLSITPKGQFASGNLVLVLKDLNSTLSIDFVPAQKEFDARSEIRVQAKGPNTQLLAAGLPESLDTSLLSVLQGVAPTGSKELITSSSAVQAWMASSGDMYVRTRYRVMSPAFTQVTSSPDGTFAYKMVAVPVVYYKTQDGKDGEFSVEGF